MYYFYLNFPTYKDKPIKIHNKECGFCNPETGCTYNGFWAGPFVNINDAETSLKNLNKLMSVKFEFGKCSCCR